MYIFDYELALMDTVIGSKSVYNLSKVLEESEVVVDDATHIVDSSGVLASLIEDFKHLGADIFVVGDPKGGYGSFNGSISADLGTGFRLYMFSIKVDFNSKFVRVLHTLEDLGSYMRNDYDANRVFKHRHFGDFANSSSSSAGGTLGDLLTSSLSELATQHPNGYSSGSEPDLGSDGGSDDGEGLATYSLGVSRVSRLGDDSKGGN